MKHILKCQKCGNYTMAEICPCGGNTISQKQPKFSLQDTYGKYRRRIKHEQLRERGLI